MDFGFLIIVLNHLTSTKDNFFDSLAEANQNRTNNKKSYYTLIKQSYQALVNDIIRPPRCGYEISQLGPRTFNFCGKIFERLDFCLENPRKLKFECSMWQPVDKDRQNSVIPCVIYMHGNSSSRLEALPALSLVLSLGASLLSFDFSGSGKSEGEYVSLGAFEKDDLQCVIEHLRTAGNTSTIALWGRSMGAATALLHGERDPSIVSSHAILLMYCQKEEFILRKRMNSLQDNSSTNELKIVTDVYISNCTPGGNGS